MSRASPALVLLSVLTVVPACASLKREFDPPIGAENNHLKVSVRRLQLKKGRLRIWADLVNKSDATLLLRYSDFRVHAGEEVHAGALRVPFVRVTKEFEMPPYYHKPLSQPIEFLDVGAPEVIDFVVENIRVQGQEGSSSVSVRVPLGPPPDND